MFTAHTTWARSTARRARWTWCRWGSTPRWWSASRAPPWAPASGRTTCREAPSGKRCEHRGAPAQGPQERAPRPPGSTRRGRAWCAPGRGRTPCRGEQPGHEHHRRHRHRRHHDAGPDHPGHHPDRGDHRCGELDPEPRRARPAAPPLRHGHDPLRHAPAPTHRPGRRGRADRSRRLPVGERAVGVDRGGRLGSDPRSRAWRRRAGVLHDGRVRPHRGDPPGQGSAGPLPDGRGARRPRRVHPDHRWTDLGARTSAAAAGPVRRSAGTADLDHVAADAARRRPRRARARRRQPLPAALGLRSRRRALHQVGRARVPSLVPPHRWSCLPVGRARPGGVHHPDRDRHRTTGRRSPDACQAVR
jgi:hypothetical protein